MIKRVIRVAIPTAAAAGAMLVIGAPAASADSASFQECIEAEQATAGPGGASASSFEKCIEASSSTGNGGDNEDDGLLGGLLGGLL